MNIPILCSPPTVAATRAAARSGSAAITMIILVTAACVMIGSLLFYSSSETRMSRVALDQQKALIAAEAGLDYGVMQLHNILATYKLNPQVAQSDFISSINLLPDPPALPGPYVYSSPTGSTFSISVDTPIVTGVLTQGNFIGNIGFSQQFTVTCGASNTITHLSVALQKRVQAFGLYVVSFGVFYQGSLEVQPGSTMTFRGPVHCNGSIYLGGPLAFYDKITSSGDVFVKRLNDYTTLPEPEIQDTHSNLVSMLMSGNNTVEANYMDSANVNWASQALVKWQGQILTRAHGVGPINPPIALASSPHDLIERAIPPPGVGQTNPLYNATTEAAKFANTAALRIYVKTNRSIQVTDIFTNTIVQTKLQGSNPPVTFTNKVVLRTNGIYKVYSYMRSTNLFVKDVDGAYSMTQTGMVAVGQSFYDARQMTNMAPVDIYLDQLMTYYPDFYTPSCYSTTQGQGAIYITSDPPTNSLGKPDGMPCVRLRNGAHLLTALTISSDLPVYIEGNFNLTNSAGLTKTVCVVGDAITMLSSVWQDAKSTGPGNVRIPSNTTYNLSMMTGNLATTPGVSASYNGGLENEIRFLEDWTANTVKFRGAIINLWNSEMATGAWGGNNTTNGFVYGVPQVRDWGYDQIYRVSNPPTIPMVYGMEEIQWGLARGFSVPYSK